MDIRISFLVVLAMVATGEVSAAEKKASAAKKDAPIEREVTITTGSYVGETSFNNFVAKCQQLKGVMSGVTSKNICGPGPLYARNCNNETYGACTYKKTINLNDDDSTVEWLRLYGNSEVDCHDTITDEEVNDDRCIAKFGAVYEFRTEYSSGSPSDICAVVTNDMLRSRISYTSTIEPCEKALGVGYGWFRDGNGLNCYKTKPTGDRIRGSQPVATHLCPALPQATGRNGTYSKTVPTIEESGDADSDSESAGGSSAFGI